MVSAKQTGMKCSICSGPATVRLEHFNLKLCPADFVRLVEQRIERAIVKFGMFDRTHRILVAVSGGKDSLSLWHALNRLGYAPDALFVRLGNSPLVDQAQAIVQKAAGSLPGKLHILDATDYSGRVSIQEVARVVRRPVCAVCGLARRYLINRFAVEHGYDVVATGHNLTDEAAALLGNLLHWHEGYLQRQWPLLPKTHPRFAAKAKPMALNYEQDIKLYAELNGIEHLADSCPFAVGATSRIYKRLLLELEQEQPGIIAAFYLGYVRREKPGQQPVPLRDCSRCSFPTTAEVCAFCRLQERFSRTQPTSAQKPCDMPQA
jgi:uncharacterized protein (TIGR00269 family)